MGRRAIKKKKKKRKDGFARSYDKQQGVEFKKEKDENKTYKRKKSK